MTDKEIVELYWRRDGDAISRTAGKYGAYCHTIAFNILGNREDSEECVNDTWVKAWNSMPTNRPSSLAPYLGKMTRWLSLSRLRDRNSLRHGGGEGSLALEELRESLDSGRDVQKDLEQKELASSIRRFVSRLEMQQQDVFIARYWYMASIEEISQRTGFSRSKTKSMLMRMRTSLKKYLEEEGLC